MTAHLSEERLNDLVDGIVPEPERADMERHLSACPSCAEEVARQQALLSRLALLPRSADPGVDLRPAIRMSLGLGVQTGWRAQLWTFRYPLATAAILLIVLSSSLTLWISRDGADPTGRVATPSAPEPPAAVPVASHATFQALESGYAREVEALQRAVDEQGKLLQPATVRLLEHNLMVIDRAIAESRAALRADPGSGVLQQMLLSTYQQKLELLRRAGEIGSVL